MLPVAGCRRQTAARNLVVRLEDIGDTVHSLADHIVGIHHMLVAGYSIGYIGYIHRTVDIVRLAERFVRPAGLKS